MFEILVLGATGFIGGHIAKSALHASWTVSGLRRDPGDTGHLNDQRIRWVDGDLRDQNSLLSAMRGKDIVFHAAGFYPPDNDRSKTAQYTAQAASQMNRVLQAAKQANIKKLIYTSSLSTIGLPPRREDRLADERDFYQKGSLPDNGYYESKIVQEELALTAHREGLFVVILNPTAVFGPGDVHLGTGQILQRVARGSVKAVPSGTLNIIDVRDLAEAHLNAARTGKSGERYILGGENYSIFDAITRFASFLNVPPPRYTLPSWSLDVYLALSRVFQFLPEAPFHLQAHRYWQGYNTSKAVQELNLQTRLLEETIRDSIRWYSNQGML